MIYIQREPLTPETAFLRAKGYFKYMTYPPGFYPVLNEESYYRDIVRCDPRNPNPADFGMPDWEEFKRLVNMNSRDGKPLLD